MTYKQTHAYRASLSAFLILSLASPAPAFAEPGGGAPEADASSCRNVGNRGSYSEGIARRDREKDQVCGNNSVVVQEFKNVERKLNICKNLGRSLKSGTVPNLDFSNFQRLMVPRYQKVCQAYLGYHRESRRICHRYKTAQSKVETLANQVDRINNGCEAERASERLATEAANDFRQMKAWARTSGQMIDDNARGVTDAQDADPQMTRLVTAIKSSLKSYTDNLRAQANQSLAQRNQTAGAASDGNEVGIRFANQRMYQQFLNDLRQCESLAANNSEFDRANRVHQEKLAKEVGRARKEADEAHTVFGQDEAKYTQAAATARGHAAQSGTLSSANPHGCAAAPRFGELPDRPAPADRAHLYPNGELRPETKAQRENPAYLSSNAWGASRIPSGAVETPGSRVTYGQTNGAGGNTYAQYCTRPARGQMSCYWYKTN